MPDRRETTPRRGRRKSSDAVEGLLRPHNPFELIRWLALSQPDPRKALAELVQNSLDAGATKIRITRQRERREPAVCILDNGAGVIPEMDRPEALKYIATHIGHSRKKSLSPQERLHLMTQGQYGIGLLGFWSLGQMLEMRSAVPGQRPYRLVLYRDKPKYVIEPLRGRLPLEERWTEVVVVGLHREAMGVLAARRAADYLASELRGQLLSRDVDLVVHDRLSRGRAQKLVTVRPPRFLGERLEAFDAIDVPGHPPIRLEIYVAGEPGAGDGQGGLAVYCAGTLVAESFSDLASLGLDRPPWTDARLTGLVDFPGLSVAPGSRRGLVPDEVAGAFARALSGLEPALDAILDTLERRKADELDKTMIRDLQRAFRDFYRQRPRYEMLPVQSRKADAPAAGAPGTQKAVEGQGAGNVGGAEEAEPGETVEPESAQAARVAAFDLLPPGPLAQVRMTPNPIRVECRGTRRARAVGLDATGRPLDETVDYEWRLGGPVGRLTEETPGQVTLLAGEEPAEGSLSVTARAAGGEAWAEVGVEVVEEIPTRRPDEGIPEPEFVDFPGAPWRSRMVDDQWQVNIGHREYRAIAGKPTLKLRYLAMLFGKEVVLRSSQDPRLEKPLEQLVEVTAFADRNIAGRRGRKRDEPEA